MADTIGEMDKGWGEKIVFSVNEFKNKKYADIRIYYEDDEGEWKPTKKGITVALSNFSEFMERIAELEAFLKSRGLVEPAESSDA